MTSLLLALALAPVPPGAGRPVPEVAPPPRPMSVYYDENGVLRHYSRWTWDGGSLRRRIHEGDPEFQVPVWPAAPAAPGAFFPEV